MLRKKKKSSKLVRMNEEERMRYIQHRLEFELETKRRKQQLIAVFTKVYYSLNFLIIIFKINL